MPSRFAARAKARARSKVPSRAVRRAHSPREPKGPQLRYQVAMRQVAALFRKQVASALSGKLDGVIAGGKPPSLKASRATIRKGAAAIVRGTVGAVGKRTDQHVQGELERLGIVRSAKGKAKRETRTDAADGSTGGGRPPRRGVRIREDAPKVGTLIEGWRRENVDKITSLVGAELDTIEKLLTDGEGRRVESLQKDIEARFGVTQSKAELLARDQVLKLNAAITRERQIAAGVTEYIWTTSNDERVREMHAELEGKRIRWDDPPVTNTAGERNHAGSDYGCRCTPFAVLTELDEELFDVAAE